MSEENKETSFSAFNDFLRRSREGYVSEKKEETEEVKQEETQSPEEENIDIDEIIEGESSDTDIDLSSVVEGETEEDSDIIDINNGEEVSGGFTPQFVDDSEETETEDEGELSAEETETEDNSETAEETESETDSEETEKNNSIDISNLLEVNEDSDEDEGEEETEGQYFDPLEEQLIYSSGDDEVNFNDLNNSSEDDDDDEEEEKKENKKSNKIDFDKLNGSKGKYVAGQSRKTLILSILVGILAFLFLCLEIKKIMSDRKTLAEKGKTNTEINTSDYNPDFGDYASRAHIQTSQEKNQSDANYAEGLLTTNDRKDYENSNVGNVGKSTSPSYAYQTQQTGNVAPVPENTALNDAVTSQIRYTDFNGTSGSNNGFPQIGANMGYGSNVSYMPYGGGMGQDPVTGYMEQYNQLVNSLSDAAGQNKNSTSSKRNFNNGASDKNAKSGMTAIPENSIYPGTIIHAVMVSGINTDYPGAITARVLNNVYDSKTGKNLLIPSGTILRGSYSSASIGISRTQIAWTEMIINRDGLDYLVTLGSMAGVDRKGYSGIKGTLNDHYFSYIRAMGLSSLFTVLNQNVYKYSNAQKSAAKRELIAENQDLVNSLTDKLLDRALEIEPTITISPGTLVSVDVDKIITLVPFNQDVPKQRYTRK